jgi:hypothetical protein
MAAEKRDNHGVYHFTLYIDSQKPRSDFVAERLRKLCELHLIGGYKLIINDLRENPALFEEKRIFAVPTCEVETPLSRQYRFVGDLTNTEAFITAIGMAQTAVKMGKEAAEMKEEAIRIRENLSTT